MAQILERKDAKIQLQQNLIAMQQNLGKNDYMHD